MKEFRRKIEFIESGAYHAAAEVLLIGLKHIKEHEMSYPMGMAPEEWFEEIVPELIWFCEAVVEDDIKANIENGQRMKAASRLLGEHFKDIWC